jgi:hypothetical protein
LGLSKFDHREKFRKFAEKNKFEITTHFLDISKSTRMKRILKRNTERGLTFEFEVSRDNFEFMEGWFERPSGKELEKAIIINEKLVK